MRAGANKYLLQIRTRSVPVGLKEDGGYRYFDTLDEAIDYTIKREQHAIALTEQNIRRQIARLKIFMKKYGRI